MSYEMLMTDLIHALHDCNASHKGYRQQERAPGTHWWYLITWLTFITSELWRHVPWHIASTRLSICDRSSVTYSQQTCYNVHVTTTITRKQFCMKFHNERVGTCNIMYMKSTTDGYMRTDGIYPLISRHYVRLSVYFPRLCTLVLNVVLIV